MGKSERTGGESGRPRVGLGKMKKLAKEYDKQLKKDFGTKKDKKEK